MILNAREAQPVDLIGRTTEYGDWFALILWAKKVTADALETTVVHNFQAIRNGEGGWNQAISTYQSIALIASETISIFKVMSLTNRIKTNAFLFRLFVIKSCHTWRAFPIFLLLTVGIINFHRFNFISFFLWNTWAVFDLIARPTTHAIPIAPIDCSTEGILNFTYIFNH